MWDVGWRRVEGRKAYIIQGGNGEVLEDGKGNKILFSLQQDAQDVVDILNRLDDFS